MESVLGSVEALAPARFPKTSTEVDLLGVDVLGVPG